MKIHPFSPVTRWGIARLAVFALWFGTILAPAPVLAQAAPDASGPTLSPVQEEVAAIAAARAAAHMQDDARLDDGLLRATRTGAGAANSVVLARRALAVCGWLQNENEHGRALRVALRVLRRLAQMQEATTEDRIERLYAEALLESVVCDNKRRALLLLDDAQSLAPEDERILTLRLELAAAIAEFGR